jgi:hypothetical protein
MIFFYYVYSNEKKLFEEPILFEEGERSALFFLQGV